MADFLKGFLGGGASSISSALPSADDFADFATAASPEAPSHAAPSAVPAGAETGISRGKLFGAVAGPPGRPYTKWYRVWERVTWRDFITELYILPVLVLVVVVNLWGSHANKSRARQWASTHFPILESEFAQVGFGRKRPSVGDAKASQGPDENSLRQKGKNEYVTYCTGRQNVAWVDIKISLHKRYNPFAWLGEVILSFFADSFPPPVERVEATAYVFDGKEKSLVPASAKQQGGKDSSYDGFVWAVVHKDKMKQLRDDRYDLSLTATRDNAKLPDWATIMSESAEVTDAMLTPELLKALEECGENLEALIVSDLPIDAPRKLNDLVPRKRVSLSMRLDTRASSTGLFTYFIRLPDQLVNTAHFRPEAMRKIRATREEEARKIRKVDEEEKAEERRLAGDKMKKEERERRLNKMNPDEQRKFLEKEREAEQRKAAKKRSMRG